MVAEVQVSRRIAVRFRASQWYAVRTQGPARMAERRAAAAAGSLRRRSRGQPCRAGEPVGRVAGTPFLQPVLPQRIEGRHLRRGRSGVSSSAQKSTMFIEALQKTSRACAAQHDAGAIARWQPP